MTSDITIVQNHVRDASTVSRVQRSGSVLSVFMDTGQPGKYEVTTDEDGIMVTEIDTMGGGRIGAITFDDPERAARHITSV